MKKTLNLNSWLLAFSLFGALTITSSFSAWRYLHNNRECHGVKLGPPYLAFAIVDPLIKKFTCHWIVQGTVRLARDRRPAVLDYGNGECDNLAIIYINGVPHIITL